MGDMAHLGSPCGLCLAARIAYVGLPMCHILAEMLDRSG